MSTLKMSALTTTGWSKLVDFKEDYIVRGALLRMPGGYPYESVVDFMVIELEQRLALLVASGYKAGLIRQVLPKDALVSTVNAISPTWLIENWSKWVDQGSVHDVWICREVAAADSLPG